MNYEGVINLTPEIGLANRARAIFFLLLYAYFKVR